jgi:hypothetical protein
VKPLDGAACHAGVPLFCASPCCEHALIPIRTRSPNVTNLIIKEIISFA